MKVQERQKKSGPVSRSGRFATGPGADVAEFTQSISFDWRLWRHDILGSVAHAEMLHKIGVLTATERATIIRGLGQIGAEIESGQFKWRPELDASEQRADRLVLVQAFRAEQRHAFGKHDGAREPAHGH